jgi:hypothetical protein
VTSAIESILEFEGPQLASVVKSRLLQKGFSDQAARQQISRVRGSVRRFTAITLPKRESFLYLDHQYSSSEFWRALLRALTEKKTAYGFALQGLIARGGILPLSYFDIVSGCPYRPAKKQLNTAFVLERLVNIGLLELVEIEGYGQCVTINANGRLIGTPDMSHMSSLILVEEILAQGVKDWLRKLGLASYNATKARSLRDLPDFGPFKWDISGPSYLFPLVKKSASGAKPGFIVADVFVEGELDVPQVQYFVKKCRMARIHKNQSPFMAILVAERFTNEAFTLGKQEGLLFTTPENLFGTAIAGALKNLLDTLHNAAAVAAKNPAKIEQLFSSLSSIEGASGNLRGALFNMIVGHLVLNDREGSIDIGKKVSDPEDSRRRAEIDVLNVRRNSLELAVYECKGWLSPIDKETVEEWLTKKVPLIYKALRAQARFRNSKFQFEIWTSSYFKPDAQEYLEARRKDTKKYEIGWKCGPEILEYSQNIRLAPISEMLNEHYLKHPLAIDSTEGSPSTYKLLTT